MPRPTVSESKGATYVVVGTHDDDLIGNFGLGGEFGFG